MKSIGSCFFVVAIVFAALHNSRAQQAEIFTGIYNTPNVGCDSSVSYIYENPPDTNWFRATVNRRDAKGYITRQLVYDNKYKTGIMLAEITRVVRDSNGLATETSRVPYQDTSYILFRTLCTYDSAGRLKTVHEQYRAYGNMATLHRDTLYYDSLGRIDSIRGLQVIGISRDGNGNVTSRLYYRRDHSAKTYIPNMQFNYTHDSNNSLTDRTFETSSDGKKWVLTHHDEYTYKSNGAPSVFIYRWRQTDSTTKIREIDSFINQTDYKRWDVYTADTFVHIQYACLLMPGSGIEVEAAPWTLKVYPNPASGRLTIELNPSLLNSTLSIIDISGRRIKSEKVLNISHSIDVSGFTPGIYLLQLIAQNGQPYYARFLKH